MLLTPQMIETAASNIVDFWSTSELADIDKQKILEMVKDYYANKDEYIHDQYLSALTDRTINANVPQTGFENKNA